MALATATTPLRLRIWQTNPMRRMFVSRSSLENPSPLLRWVRTTSPSSTSTFMPRLRSSFTTISLTVVLPAPLRPVNQSVNPLCSMLAACSSRSRDGHQARPCSYSFSGGLLLFRLRLLAHPLDQHLGH